MSAPVVLAGIGTAVPEGRLDSARAAALIPRLLGLDERGARAVAALVARAGVRSRPSVLIGPGDEVALYTAGGPWPGTAARMAAYREWAPGLAERAARVALEDARWRPSDVTHLVVVTCTGFGSPGVDLALVERLGLSPSVGRVQVGFMGCHGAINGLAVARGLASDPAARVLLVAVELCSLHFGSGTRPGADVASLLFGDGAAAAALGGRASGRGLALVGTGSMVLEDSAALMSWDVGDTGFEMGLSPEVPRAIEAGLAPWLERWLGSHDLAIADIGGFAVHPGGVRILDAVERALGLPPEALAASRAHLAELGNLSSPTVLFLVERLLGAGASAPYLLLAFGPGLAAEAGLLVQVSD